MGTVVDIAATAALGLGLLLATIGLYGLLRMPDVFAQLHAAGLITGPAVLLVLLASVATGSAEIITSAVLVVLFVLVTSPLSSHAIAQAAHQRGDDDPDGRQS
jgi:multicomponent Na+:H+ antiporter subunit G